MRKVKPAIFLDRDGVINFDSGYAHKLEDLMILPGVSSALTKLGKNNFWLIVVTNQSGIARGYFDFKSVNSFNDAINQQLQASHSPIIDEFFICPHHPDGNIPSLAIQCQCRKPGTGLVEQAVKKWPIDLPKSFVIGDKQSDIQLGKSLNIPAIQIDGGVYPTDPTADFICKTLPQAVDFIADSCRT